MKSNIRLVMIATIVSVFFTPTSAFAVAVNGACTGTNSSAGVCKSASAGGSAGCNVSMVLGAGNCDAGLICCSQGSQPAPAVTIPPGSIPDGSTCLNNVDCQSGICTGNIFSAKRCQSATVPAGTNNTGGLQPAGINNNSSSGSGVTLINPLSSGNCNSTNSDCLENFLLNILRFVVRIGGIIVVLMYVFVGFKFVTAQGNESKITEAKTMLLWTTIGGLVLLGAQVIAMAIKATVQGLTSGG